MYGVIMKIIISIVISALIPLGVFSQNSREDLLYKQLLKKTFSDGKKIVARKLGRLKTKKARKYLISLIDNSHYWNRQGAVAGLLMFRDNEVTQLLINKYIHDHMIDDDIERGFIKNMKFYYPFLVKKYDYFTAHSVWRGDDYRKKIIKTIGKSRYWKGAHFFKKNIRNINSKDRMISLKFLGTYYRGQYEFIKFYLNDEELKTVVLEYLVVNGKYKDLPLFLKIIRKNEKPAYVIRSYKGVKRWGSIKLQRRIFLDSLNKNIESQHQAALIIFHNVTSIPIKKRIIRLVYKAILQRTRILGGLALTKYSTKDIIPPLIALLDEPYKARERGGIDTVLTGFTFGITSIFDDIRRRSERSDYRSNILKLLNKLQTLSGKNFGHSKKLWKDWAVFNGYTIEGVNIIQYLYSAYPEIRKKAIRKSIKIIGYRSVRSFYFRHKKIKNENDVILYLSKILLKRGYLKSVVY